jgi:hypothetical protein
MDGGTTTKQSVLMENSYNWAMLSLNISADSTYSNISNLVVINALDVNTTVRFVDKPNISPGNTAITTTIY